MSRRCPSRTSHQSQKRIASPIPVSAPLIAAAPVVAPGPLVVPGPLPTSSHAHSLRETILAKVSRATASDGLGVLRRRCLFQAQQADRLLTHLDLADLARHRHRELLDDVHIPRDLVARELAFAELPHL